MTKYINIDYSYYTSNDINVSKYMLGLLYICRTNNARIRLIFREKAEYSTFNFTMMYADQVLIMKDGYWNLVKCRETGKLGKYSCLNVNDFDENFEQFFLET